MRTKTLFDIVTEINTLRANAGLAPIHWAGMSKMSAIVKLNKAQRSDFS